MKQTILILALLFVEIVSGQSTTINGSVKDDSGEPIPFAHIRIAGTYSGTLTNLEGEFRLPISNPANTQLLVSCVGFISQTTDITPDIKLEIVLKEDLITLQEVIIVPKDYARELVLAAIESIPKNYPTSEEMIEGFIRETLSRDSLGDSLHYISEAQTESAKTSYTKSKTQGDVKLIKGRKLDIDTDDLGIRVYAGAHLPHRFDFVMRREGPLNPKRLDKYIYQIDDTLRYNGKSMYQVGYLSRDGQETGTISIIDKSFAIAGIERLENSDRFKGAIKANRRHYLKSVTTYNSHEDSLWRLNFITYSTMFSNGPNKTYLNSQFTAHGFESKKESITYADRIQFGDFLLEEVNDFDPEFWTNYNVTLPDQKFEEAYEQKPEEQAKKEKKNLLYFMRRLEFGYSLSTINTRMHDHNLSYNQTEIFIDETLQEQQLSKLAIMSIISYRLSDRSLINYHSSRVLGGNRSREYFLGYTYRVPIKKRSRIFIAGTAGYNFSQLNRQIPSVLLENNTRIGGKKIDADKVDVYSSSAVHSIMTSLSIYYEKSSRLKLYISADHYSHLSTTNGLLFREDQGIFKRKEVFVKDGKEGLKVSSEHSAVFERNLGVRFGFIWGI